MDDLESILYTQLEDAFSKNNLFRQDLLRRLKKQDRTIKNILAADIEFLSGVSLMKGRKYKINLTVSHKSRRKTSKDKPSETKSNISLFAKLVPEGDLDHFGHNFERATGSYVIPRTYYPLRTLEEATLAELTSTGSFVPTSYGIIHIKGSAQNTPNLDILLIEYKKLNLRDILAESSSDEQLVLGVKAIDLTLLCNDLVSRITTVPSETLTPRDYAGKIELHTNTILTYLFPNQTRLASSWTEGDKHMLRSAAETISRTLIPSDSEAPSKAHIERAKPTSHPNIVNLGCYTYHFMVDPERVQALKTDPLECMDSVNYAEKIFAYQTLQRDLKAKIANITQSNKKELGNLRNTYPSKRVFLDTAGNYDVTQVQILSELDNLVFPSLNIFELSARMTSRYDAVDAIQYRRVKLLESLRANATALARKEGEQPSTMFKKMMHIIGHNYALLDDDIISMLNIASECREIGKVCPALEGMYVIDPKFRVAEEWGFASFLGTLPDNCPLDVKMKLATHFFYSAHRIKYREFSEEKCFDQAAQFGSPREMRTELLDFYKNSMISSIYHQVRRAYRKIKESEKLESKLLADDHTGKSELRKQTIATIQSDLGKILTIGEILAGIYSVVDIKRKFYGIEEKDMISRLELPEAVKTMQQYLNRLATGLYPHQ